MILVGNANSRDTVETLNQIENAYVNVGLKDLKDIGPKMLLVMQ